MRKSSKKKLIFIILVAFATIFFVRKSTPKVRVVEKTKVIEKKQAEKIEYVQILVAAYDLNAGVRLMPKDTKWKKIDKRNLDSMMIDKEKFKIAVKNKVTNNFLKKGAIIYISDLTDFNNSIHNLTPGMAIHSFKVNSSRGIGHIIKPHSYVRIIYVKDGKSVVIVDQARVLSVKVNSPLFPYYSKKNQKEYNHKFASLDPSTLVDDDVFVEVTPQLAQVLSLNKEGEFVLIPIKYHPKSIVPGIPYHKDDLSRTFFTNAKRPGAKYIKTIRGDKVTFKDISHSPLSKGDLSERPVEEKKKENTKVEKKLKPPYRLSPKVRPPFKLNTKEK